MNVVQQPTPPDAYRNYPQRPRLGIYLHHTAGSINDAPPAPRLGASWHKLFLPDGTVFNAVPPSAAPHCVLKTDIFTPVWQFNTPDFAVSAANYCADHWEIQYAPQAPYNEHPTSEQLSSIKQSLIEHYAHFPNTPVLGHGQVQSDKWPSEPHDLDYYAIGLGDFQPYTGRFLTQEPQPMNPADDATIKGWLESAGIPINPDTAIMQYAYACFRQGPPPFGNWRGPALDPGEYSSFSLDGRPVIRHRFTAGIIEFDPQTGGLGWVEVVAHPEQIDP